MRAYPMNIIKGPTLTEDFFKGCFLCACGNCNVPESISGQHSHRVRGRRVTLARDKTRTRQLRQIVQHIKLHFHHHRSFYNLLLFAVEFQFFWDISPLTRNRIVSATLQSTSPFIYRNKSWNVHAINRTKYCHNIIIFQKMNDANTWNYYI